MTVAWVAGGNEVASSDWFDENLDLQLCLCCSIGLTHSTWKRASASHSTPALSNPGCGSLQGEAFSSSADP